MRFATKTIHAAQPSDVGTGALTAPIFQTSTFEQDAPGVHAGYDYSRTNNPTRERLERVLAVLEGVEHCAVYGSGLAAENAIFQGLLKPGDAIVIPPDVYGGTFRLLTQVFAPIGVQIRQVDLSNLEDLAAALDERVRIVWIETPTNPRLLIYDIAAIAKLAHARGALVAVDNTFATPLLQQPFALGADIVVHSVTKYLSGHSDVIQGAVLAREATVFERIKFLQNACGATPGPFDCWLTLRGLKTLELRVQRHCENAAALANAIVGHPAVQAVHYPGLATHPGHDIARRQMAAFGGLLSIELNGSLAAVAEFVSTRRYFTLAESLGGVKSLICHPAAMTHKSIPAEVRRRTGLSDSLVRLSPGIEHPDDLIEDVRAGLDDLAAGQRRSPAVRAGLSPARS